MIPSNLVPYANEIKWHLSLFDEQRANAEVFLINVLKYKWKYIVSDDKFFNPNYRLISYKKPDWEYCCTVIVNPVSYYKKTLLIDTNIDGSLFSLQSDKVFHVCYDTGWMAWFKRSEMQEWIINQQLLNTGIIELKAGKDPAFVTRKKEKIY